MTEPAEARRWRRVWRVDRFSQGGQESIVTQLYLVLIATRCVLGLHAVAHNLIVALPRAQRPGLVVLACVVIIAWTGFFSLSLRTPAHRTLVRHAFDCLVTVAVIALTPLAMGTEPSRLTLAGYWVAGCVLYAGIFLSTVRGLVVWVLTFIAYLAEPTAERVDVAGMTLLTLLATSFMLRKIQRTIAERELEQARSAALAERERLFRIVHDGALQVLAMVEREGHEFGPKGRRLALLARQSEADLRRLLQDRSVNDTISCDEVDLSAALDRYQSATVTVSTMAGSVLLPRLVIDEVLAAVEQALSNIAQHAGPGAKAWILLDQDNDDEVTLWIRDNGVGMDPELVARAADRGRMGIKDSIVGRIQALGGDAILTSARGSGAEWEFHIPVKGRES